MTYYLDLFGCVKNQVDAENMMAFLSKAGWTVATDAENADLIIVNSCGFIESAKQESINAVLLWRRLYPRKKILLAGCLAQRYAKELSESLPEADGFFGIEDISRITQAAGEILDIPFDASPKPRTTRQGKRPLLSLPGSAYVKISEGCDNNCSFCAIPLIRGSLRSRSIPDVTEECKTLLGRGIKELCLIGQDTGSYGKDLPASGSSNNLPGLLKAISALDGIFWVRLLYIHPEHFPLPILDIMEKDKRFVPYFDIPFQHGSEKILRLMNRRVNSDFYLDLIKTIRIKLPDAVIRSTFITGFPGETDEDFGELLNFQKNAELDWLGCFTYSREENTPSYNLKGRVPKKTAAERKRLIEENQVPITEKRMESFVGRVFDVLVEEEFEPLKEESTAENSADTSGTHTICLGRLPCQAPEVDGSAVIHSPRPLQLGAIVPCKIFARAGFDLQAEPV